MQALSIISWLMWLFLFGNPPTPSNLKTNSSSFVEGINAVDGFTPQELVEDIFVKGACKNIFNISSSGRAESIGFFESGGDVIGLEEGIVLATGPIEHVEGPNNEGKRSGQWDLRSNDPDLKKLANSDTIRDAAVLEFDFIPLDSLITFRYVFASEEYCEFVDNLFNDVFGFFVSGPGIRGPFSDDSENVALIPGTQDFVSINSVNHLRNEEFYISNVLEEDANRCDLDFMPSPIERKFQMDGFTKILTATLQLIPCETYHLRLVVADVGDDLWDSAVFLEAESFNIGGNLELETFTSIESDTIPEGCNYGNFRVARSDLENIDEDITIGLRVGANSTAIEGEDFIPLPDSVTIPAGQETIDIPIQVLIDEEDEPLPEKIILEFDFPCACIADTAILHIVDPLGIVGGVPDMEACKGENIRLEAMTFGGIPSYTYRWSTGSEKEAISVIVNEPKTYSLSITDTCGRLKVEEILVLPKPVPLARIPNEVRSTCEGDTIQVPVSFTGQAPFQFSYSIDGQMAGSIDNIFQNPYFLTIDREGQVQIEEYADAECPGDILGQTDLRYYRIQTLINTEASSCFEGSDGQIQVEVVGGTAPYDFDWGPGLPNSPTLEGLSEGLYESIITDANGCSTMVEASIQQPGPIRPIDFECREFEADFLQINTSGGTPPYLYSIDSGPFEDISIFNSLIGGESYALRIQDAQGCNLDQAFVMPVLRQQMFELQTSVKLKLGQNFRIEPQLNIPVSLVESITWSPSEGLSCTDCLTPDIIALEDQTYSLRIDDVFGCVDGASITVKLDKKPDIFIPTAFSPDGDNQNDRLEIFVNPEQIKSIAHFQVFNRWGLLIYEAFDFSPSDVEKSWDGTMGGRSLDPGIFVYTCRFVLANGAELEQNGTVLLVK